jgi:putative transposase
MLFLISFLVADPKTAFDPSGLLNDLKKALAERVLNAEMDHHLANGEADNSRNGYGKKTVVTDTARIELDVPRDRQSAFDPHLIAKYQRRFPGFDEKIISMYARGMSVREIVGHLRDLYGVDVSPDLISTVTDAVLDEVAAWQGRPLEPVYPLVFFDALRVKIRDEGLVRNKAVYVAALGVRAVGPEVVPFYAFHPDVRRLVYTTNAIEALNSKLRRAVRARGHFPTDGETATRRRVSGR